MQKSIRYEDIIEIFHKGRQFINADIIKDEQSYFTLLLVLIQYVLQSHLRRENISEYPFNRFQLNNINSPYQCVMISGEWGIGKSFQINAEIHALKPVGYCSLFGDSFSFYQKVWYMAIALAQIIRWINIIIKINAILFIVFNRTCNWNTCYVEKHQIRRYY